MERITKLEARPPFVLYVEFDDGVRGEYDMQDRLIGPVFLPLHNPDYFAQVRLSEWGAPLWPNGVDIAPDAIYERIRNASTVPGRN